MRNLWILALALPLCGQPRQTVAGWTDSGGTVSTTRRLDASTALSTKPVKVGVLFPSACGAGELFFKSDAPAGSNLYGCTSTNTWTLVSSSGASSPLTTKGDVYTHNGTTGIRFGVCPNEQALVGDSTQASGWKCASVAGGTGVSVCAPSSASGTTYTCTVADVASYTAGLTLLFRPDVASSGAVTVNVNTLGAKSVLRSSGNGVVSGELLASSSYLISYDGTSFRLQGENLEADGSSSITIGRGTNPHTIAVTSGVFGDLAGANAWLGANTFKDAYLILPEKAVASLPSAASNASKVFVVTDGASATDCVTGSGSSIVLCRSNGTVYASLGGSGGGSPTNIVRLGAGDLANGYGQGEAVVDARWLALLAKYTNGSAQHATWWTPIPTNWTGVAPSLRLFWSNDTSNSANTYKWNVLTSCDASGSGTWNSPSVLTVNDKDASLAATITTTTLPITGCTAGVDMRIRIQEGTSFTSTALHYLQGIEVVWPLS